MTMSLYQHVVTITEDYLGPAASRFVSRQIAAHLGKQPEELTIYDLPKLTEWTQVTLNLLTQEQELVNEYSQRMAQLADEASLLRDGARHNL